MFKKLPGRKLIFLNLRGNKTVNSMSFNERSLEALLNVPVHLLVLLGERPPPLVLLQSFEPKPRRTPCIREPNETKEEKKSQQVGNTTQINNFV